MSKKLKTLPVINTSAAGIDVGASCHYVCAGSGEEIVIRRFGTFTEDLLSLSDWLLGLGVKTVAMESTGVYWVNLYEVLESKGIGVCLANARYVKNVPGRKSDISDCQWIWQLHSFGLLSGSFIAEEKIRALRTYVRQRECLEQQKAAQLNMMGKALQLLNIKIKQITSKIEIQVSMNIIRAIVAGVRDGLQLSEFHHPQMKATKEELAKALQGNWKQEHLFSLKQALLTYDFFKAQMLECEKEIERSLNELNGGIDVNREKKKGTVRQNDFTFNAQAHLNELTGVNLCAIDGLDEKTVVTIISETGTDLSKWKTASHFSSWLGLAPRPKVSGEKTIGHFKQSVAGRAGRAFRAAAWSLHHSKSSIGAFYRRMAFRKGSFAAIKATARKLAVIFWNMMTSQLPYRQQTASSYEEKQQKAQIKKLEKQATKFGFRLQTINE